jgi:hypothetical protein
MAWENARYRRRQGTVRPLNRSNRVRGRTDRRGTDVRNGRSTGPFIALRLGVVLLDDVGNGPSNWTAPHRVRDWAVVLLTIGNGPSNWTVRIAFAIGPFYA